MATIDNLNFKIILDDKEFNRTVSSVLKTAKELNTTLSNLLQVSAKAQTSIATSKSKGQTAELKKQTAELKKQTAELDKQTAKHRTHNAQMKEQSAILGKLKTFAGAYLSVSGASAFLRSLVNITGEFEKQHVALRSILQDTKGADALFERLKTLAVKSPFQFGQLVSYSKQLSAFAVPLEELYDKTKMLADLSAGLGVDMYRLVLAYGQVRSASYLRGQELRQFTEAGVPILQELADKFTELEGRVVSAGEVFDRVSKRQVSFNMVDEVLTKLTSEGGRFFQMQEVLASTLAGKVSNLTDAYQIMMSTIGESQSGVLKGAVSLLTNLMKNYKDVGEAITVMVASYGAFRAIMVITTLAIRAHQTAMFGNTTIMRMFNLAVLSARKSLKGLSAALSTNGWGLIAAAAAGAAYAVYKVVTAMDSFQQMQKVVDDSVSKFTVELNSELNTLKVLIGELQAAKKGTQHYADVKKQLMSQYGKHITDIEREQIALGRLGEAYDSLAAKIQNALKLQYAEGTVESLKTTYEESQTKVLNKVAKRMKKNYSGVDIATVQGLMTGTLSFENTGISDELKNLARSMWWSAPELENEITGEMSEGITMMEHLQALTAEYEEQLKNVLEVFNGEPVPEARWEPTKGWQQKVYEYLEQSLGVDTSDADSAKAALSRLGINLDKFWVDASTITADWTKAFRGGYDNIKDQLATLEALEPDEAEKAKQSMGYYEALAHLLGLPLDEPTDMSAAIAKRGVDEARIIAEAEARLAELKAERAKKTQELLMQAKEAEIAAIPEGPEKAHYESAFTYVKEMMTHGLWGDDWKAALEELNTMGDIRLSTDEQVSSMARDYIEHLEKELYQEWRKSNPSATTAQAKQMQLKIATSLSTADLPEDIRMVLEALSEVSRLNMEMGGSENTKLSDLLKKYEDYNAQRTRLEAEYQADVAAMRVQQTTENAQVVEDAIAEAKRQYDKNLSDIDLAEEEALGTIFKETLAMTNEELTTAIKRTKELMNTMKGGTNVEGYERLAKRLVELEDTLYEMENYSVLGNYSTGTGIQEIARAYGDYRKEARKLAKIKEELTGQDAESLNITKEQENAVIKMKNALAQLFVNAGINVLLSGLKQVATTLNEISEISGDEGLGRLSETITTAVDALESGLTAFAASGNWIVSLVATAVSLVESMVNSFAEAAKFAAELREAAQAYADACEVLEVTFDESDYESMFGTNSLREAIDAYSTAQEALTKYSSALSKVINSEVMTKHGTWFSKAQYESLGAYAASLGYSLWDNGEFDYDRAQEFLDAYGDLLPSATKEALEYAIEIEEAYEDAMEVVEDYWSDIFGDLADDLTDILADAIENGSDAWTDFQEKGAEVIKSLAETMISTMLYENYLEPYIDQLTSVLGSSSNITEVTESAAAIIAQMFSGLEDGLTYAQSLYEYMEELSANLGYDWDTTSSSDLSSGIESVTEETASLLASYINAIRADVSQQNDYMAAISTTLAGIDWSWAPNLNDYMAAVQAYLSDIALSTQSTADYTASVVTQLKKVVSSETGSAAIRVAVQ